MSSWDTYSVSGDRDHYGGGNAYEPLLATEESETFSSTHGIFDDR
jgi:hypothetical protein